MWLVTRISGEGLEHQPNALELTEAGLLMDYVRSMWGYREALVGREQAFAVFVAGEISAQGASASPRGSGC